VSAKVLVLYQVPIDPAAFDQYFKTTHIPLAKQIPDLRSIDVSRGDVIDPQGPAPYYQVTTLTFDSMDDLKAAMSSGEGQSAIQDVINFATGGVKVLMYACEEV
jgi:uncharacterized protein (TIGR02118 family)